MSNKYKKSFKERLAIFIAAILDIIITGFLLMMFIIGEIDLTEIQIVMAPLETIRVMNEAT